MVDEDLCIMLVKLGSCRLVDTIDSIFFLSKSGLRFGRRPLGFFFKESAVTFRLSLYFCLFLRGILWSRFEFG